MIIGAAFREVGDRGKLWAIFRSTAAKKVAIAPKRPFVENGRGNTVK